MLASATVRPASIAAMVGRKPGAADDRRNDQVGLAGGGLDQAPLSCRRAAPGVGQKLAELLERRESRDDGQLRTGATDDVGQCFDVACSGHRDDLEAVGGTDDQVEGRLSD